MSRAVLSVGSNLGDRLGHLQGAIDALAEAVEVLAVSGVYETAPVGGPQQDDFLNAVVLIEARMTPHDLLAVCQGIEFAHDRVREIRWGPRTLDIDIIAMDGAVMDDASLTLPHPRAHERAFVCVPWLEVDPAASLPQGPVTGLALDPSGVVPRAELALRVPGDLRP